MNRTTRWAALVSVFLGAACGANGNEPSDEMVDASERTVTTSEVRLPQSEWERLLTDDEYNILRRAGTERAHTGDLLNNHEDGVYVCAGCGLPLFDSETKFDSGTGWPSYYQPIADGRVTDKVDRSYGMTRTENVCARCGGHLGHVFNDGPRPTGKRYCINSASLDFLPRARFDTLATPPPVSLGGYPPAETE